jgi:hypothetical protein
VTSRRKPDYRILSLLVSSRAEALVPVPMVLIMNVRVVVADLLVIVLMNVLGGGIESGAM